MAAFDHIGTLCSAELCNQKDFLPFTCDTCTKTYCLAHRSYATHKCKSKSVTSMECPICIKTVKFIEAQDPNEVWEAHYLNECTQKAPDKSQQVALTCGKVGCAAKLGFSNSFECPKCSVNVCLNHRMPDDHNCIGCSGDPAAISRLAFLNRFSSQAVTTNPPSRKGASFTAASASSGGGTKKNNKSLAEKKAAAAAAQQTGSNSLKGSADRRKVGSGEAAAVQVVDLTGGSSSVVICPFCQFTEEDTPAGSASLSDHVLAFHSEAGDGDASSAVLSSIASSVTHASHPSISNDESSSPASVPLAAGASICPQCGGWFVDDVALVRHFETNHGSSVNNDNDNSSNINVDTQNSLDGNASGQTKNKDCTVS